MELSRQEYPALLASLQPEQAVNILGDRVDLITKVNTDIADWLHERRKVEENYAAGLRKLARRPQQDGASALGIFQMPWQRIVSGTENLAQSHETLAAKIESDVETPLRQFAAKNREMQTLSTTQGNLAAIAKEYSSSQKKYEKSKGTTGRQKMDENGQLWDSQAPFVYEQLQALDETRVNHLRDVLTQFQTHEVDQVERNRLSAESCLNALLNIETADEIKTFAARVSGGRASVGSVVRRPSSAAASVTRPMSSSLGPAPTPPPRLTRDSNSRGSGTDAGQDRLTPLPEKTPHKSSLGGLKRLGTVIGRRKNAAPPPPPSSSEKRKEKGRSFAPFRRGNSERSFQDLEETGRDLTPVPSSTYSQPDASQDRPSQYRQPSFEPVGNERLNEPLAPSSNVNGTTLPGTPDPSRSAEPQVNHFYPTPASPYKPPPPQELSAIPSSPDYIPPPGPPPSDAIPRAQQEVVTSPTEPDESTRNLVIRDQPVQEDETEAKQALNNVANQLRMQAQSSGVNRVQGSVRGRRDVRNTMFMPNPPTFEEPPAAAASTGMSPAPTILTGVAAASAAATGAVSMNELASPIKRSGTTNSLLDEHAAVSSSDANSIHSSHTLAGLVQHDETSEPGLNASILETVNTWFAEGGTVSRSYVVGEVALAFNSAASEGKAEETIRLENFQVLEKVAANPTFVSSASTSTTGKQREGEDQAGEYTINTSAIRKSAPTVALKYQLHIDPGNPSSYSPLLLSPAWQINEGQVSVIVVYCLNPAFETASAEGVTLRNVVVSVSLDVSEASSGRAASAMMKPTEGAAFRRKASAVVWRIGEVKLGISREGEEDKKLLVRFLTQGGMPKRGNVEVKFEVVGGLGGGLGVKRMSAVAEVDPFADGGEEQDSEGGRKSTEWVDVPTKRKLVSGKYTAA